MSSVNKAAELFNRAVIKKFVLKILSQINAARQKFRA